MLSHPPMHYRSYPLLFHPPCQCALQTLPHPGLAPETPHLPVLPVVRVASPFWLFFSSLCSSFTPSLETNLTTWAQASREEDIMVPKYP